MAETTCSALVEENQTSPLPYNFCHCGSGLFLKLLFQSYKCQQTNIVYIFLFSICYFNVAKLYLRETSNIIVFGKFSQYYWEQKRSA